MKYINQLEYPDTIYITNTKMEGEALEKGKRTTVKGSGCCLCSAVMVADRLIPNCDFDLKQAIDLSYEVKANYRYGTSYIRYAPAFAEKLGLRYEPAKTMEEVRNCLLTGGAAVALVAGDQPEHVGLFSHNEHYVAVIGYESDGRLVVLDPYLYDGKFEEQGREGRVELKYGVMALCNEQELAGDVVGRNYPYYLFWRK